MHCKGLRDYVCILSVHIFCHPGGPVPVTISPKTNDRSSIPICVPASLRCQTLQAIVTAQDEELLTSPAMPPLFFCVTQERCPAVTPARGHQCST